MRSGLEEELESPLTTNGKQYVIYGDSGYNIRVFMDLPFQSSNLNSAQKAFNMAVSKVRVIVEWMFKEVKLYRTKLGYKRKMRIAESPVGALYLGAMLLTNMFNCVYPNTIAQCLKCTAPSLEQCLVHKD